jgi:hypothetical protein
LAYAGLLLEQEAVRAGLHITTLLQAYTKYDLPDIAAKARLVFDTRVEMVAESVYPL